MKVYSKVFNNSSIEIFQAEDSGFEFVVKSLNGKREHTGWSATKIRTIEEAKKVANNFVK